MSWHWNGAAVDDRASLTILQSLADRCKKIHAGDEVIQVNHQTVVRLSLLFHVGFFLYLLCEFAYDFFPPEYFPADCSGSFNSHMLVFAHTQKCLPQIVYMPWICNSLYTFIPVWATAAVLDLLLYEWLGVVPLVGSLWGCGWVTLNGWICYSACHRVSRIGQLKWLNSCSQELFSRSGCTCSGPSTNCE